MAVLPMVETCARQTWAPDNRASVVSSKRRIANSFPGEDLARARFAHRAHRYLAAVRQVDHRIEDDLIARFDAFAYLNLRAEVARDRDLLKTGGAILDHRDVQAILIEYDGIGRYDHRWRLAWDEQLDGAIDPGIERPIRIRNIDLGQQRSAAGLQRGRDACHLAWKRPIRNLGNADHR